VPAATRRDTTTRKLAGIQSTDTLTYAVGPGAGLYCSRDRLWRIFREHPLNSTHSTFTDRRRFPIYAASMTVLFPPRPAFAMTINKVQGQMLQCVGVLLDELVFTYGQPYVASSRCGDPQNIRFCVDNRQTANVVYTGSAVTEVMIVQCILFCWLYCTFYHYSWLFARSAIVAAHDYKTFRTCRDILYSTQIEGTLRVRTHAILLFP